MSHYAKSLALFLLLLLLGSLGDPKNRLCGQETALSQFNHLLDESWDYDMRENPLAATRTGDHRFNDQLPDVSLADEVRRAEAKRGFLARLTVIGPLGNSQRVNREMFERLLRRGIAEHGFNAHLIPITNRQGFHIDFPDLAKTSPFETVTDYENFIARMRKFPAYTEQHIEIMREGMERGYTLPSVVLEGFAEPIEAHIVDDATISVFYKPFEEFGRGVKQGEYERLRDEAQVAILEGIIPGYQAFLRFMSEEYVPAARGSIGASALPNGREYYRFCVKKFTTLPISPEEVHAIGMREVKRIRHEMEAIREQIGLEGDFADFLEHLRTEPKYYAKTKQELLNRTAFELKRIDGLLPSLFKKLPRTPYGIREIPSYIAPRTTSAYYMPPAGDGTQAGFYYVNTYRLNSRPLYGVQALSLHEAVPGHHLQLALQQELEGLPRFRKFARFTAFVEGWALYAERLGLEVGFYEDPVDDFGRLTYEIWRACRLVVDTGIHYLGWTRQQAIEFMEENSGLSKHNIRAEVDRYISWPGQALAYKMGELKIRELRKRAEDKLGEEFEIRDFHDVVLRDGAVPLDILEANVDAYIQAVTR